MIDTKARYLAQIPSVREHGVIIAGSGPQGRKMARALNRQCVRIHHFLDVAPQKIGRTALGLPVFSAADWHSSRSSAVVLGCVGHAGSMKVRALAEAQGYIVGDNFFSCC